MFEKHLLQLLYLVLPWFVLLVMGCASQDKEGSYKQVKDLTYKIVSQKKLTGDLYIPNSNPHRAAVVLVHGGGWSKRSGDMVHIAEKLVRNGFLVFNITYRLSPADPYPAAVEDVRDAILWLQENAFKYSVSPQNVTGWGYSAGAHLILMAGLNPKMKLKALVSGGTPANLSAWPDSAMVEDFIGQTYHENPNLWQEASPIHQVQEKSPPVFLYHGQWDYIVERNQMYEMEKALKSKSIPVEIYEVSWMGHISTYFYSDESVQRGMDFIKKYLRETERRVAK